MVQIVQGQLAEDKNAEKWCVTYDTAKFGVVQYCGIGSLVLQCSIEYHQCVNTMV